MSSTLEKDPIQGSAQPGAHEQTTQKDALALPKNIRALHNDQFVPLREATTALRLDLENNLLRRSSLIKTKRDALYEEVKTLQAIIDEEYDVRIYYGFHQRFKELLDATKPVPPTPPGGRRLIPINDQAAQDHEQLLHITELEEQLRVARERAGVSSPTSGD